MKFLASIGLAMTAVCLAAPAPSAAAGFGSLSVSGGGFGHGVGLSQWGAYGYAVDDGWSATQILDHFYGGTVSASVPDQDVTVRLLLHDDRQTAAVNDNGLLTVDGFAPAGPWRSVVVRELNGVFQVAARADTTVCPSSTDPLAGWVVLSGSGASVTIRSTADTTATTSYADLVALCEPNGRIRSYRGTIRAVNGTQGENRTVNQVPLEQYLRSVVAGEVPWTWSNAGGGRGAQAVQAQAVAARSYALAENRYSYARTCDLQSCQVYLGAAWRSGTTGPYTRIEQVTTDAAVRATAGQVRRMGSATGPIAYAMFSSSSGGQTAPTSLGFVPVADAGDDTTANPYHRWTSTLSEQTVRNAYPTVGEPTGVTVLARDGAGPWGGRVTSVRVTGTSGSVTVTGDRFRSAVGLRSTLFSLDGAAPAPTPPPTGGGCATRVAPPVVEEAAEQPAARFVAVTPVRLVDTRDGLGAPLGVVPGGCTIAIDPQVPDDASAVVVNVTAVDADFGGFVTAYPCGQARPWTSATQARARGIVAGGSIVSLGADGRLCVFVQPTTHLVVDLFGYYLAGGGERFEPIATQRRADTRGGAMPAAGSVTRVAIAGSGGIPADARAVALTVHAVDARAPGFVSVYPCSDARPWVSNLNVVAGSSITNHVEVGLSPAGEVCVYVMAPMHIVVDVSGWYGPSATTEFTAVTPVRALDSRDGTGLSGTFAAGVDRSLSLGGSLGLPAAPQLRAVVAMVTTTEAAAAGFVTVHACRQPVPDVSMVRYVPGTNMATTVVGDVDPAGRWCLRSSATTHVVADVYGYFAG